VRVRALDGGASADRVPGCGGVRPVYDLPGLSSAAAATEDALGLRRAATAVLTAYERARPEWGAELRWLELLITTGETK
jgi:hypothetical protein